MTPAVESLFRITGSQENEKDPFVIAKFFNPSGAGTWYATEWFPEEGIFFGYVSIFGDECDEWGYFSLAELEEFRGTFGMRIERDLHCAGKRLSEFQISSLKGTRL